MKTPQGREEIRMITSKNLRNFTPVKVRKDENITFANVLEQGMSRIFRDGDLHFIIPLSTREIFEVT